MRAITLTSAALLVVTGCTSERVVNTGEWETSTSSPPTSACTVAATDERGEYGQRGRLHSGCRRSTGLLLLYAQRSLAVRDTAAATRRAAKATGGALNIAGAPDGVPNAEECRRRQTRSSSARRATLASRSLDAAQFAPPRPANVLPFNQTLAVARVSGATSRRQKACRASARKAARASHSARTDSTCSTAKYRSTRPSGVASSYVIAIGNLRHRRRRACRGEGG